MVNEPLLINHFPQRSGGASPGRPKGRLFGGRRPTGNGGVGAEAPPTTPTFLQLLLSPHPKPLNLNQKENRKKKAIKRYAAEDKH